MNEINQDEENTEANTTGRMTLAEFAKQNNITYGTAYKRWKANLPQPLPRKRRRHV